MGKTDIQERTPTRERIDWNSLYLILLLTLPAAVMWVMLVLWPGVTWKAAAPYTAIELLGSFAMVLLAVFILARHKGRAGTLYISAGLTGMAVIEGFLTVAAPQGDQYAWLHTLAGICGGVFFLLGTLTRFSRSTSSGQALPLVPEPRTTFKSAAWMIGACVLAAVGAGVAVTVLPEMLPGMVAGEKFTPTAWALNAVPVALFLFSGVSLFQRYRKTGAQEVLLFTAIVIFLFQASEVFYFARTWSLVWWFWQGLRLAVYFSVLSYVLNEYIRTSESLSGEVIERQRAEAALRTAEEDWRKSFNSLDEAMLIINRDYSIVRVNESGLAMIKESADQAIGAKCYDVLHAGTRPGKECPCRSSFRTGRPATTERYDAQRGRYYAIKSAPIPNLSGRPEKCVCLMRDISREVKAREKEQKLQQELNTASRLASIGEVAAGIAHEINNPLTGVIGFAQMLSEMDVPEPMREAVDVIQDGARRTASIVQKLLTFARHNRSTKEPVDINAVLKSTIDIRAYQMRTSDTEVETILAEDLPRTLANYGQLQQVFLNLIINAEQAMQAAGRPGKLTVKTERLNGKSPPAIAQEERQAGPPRTRRGVRISVEDNGVGVPRENLVKLFDPFFTTKADNGGTGLGLSVSYGIIKEHGGSLRVKSKPGEGATFIIDLPVKSLPAPKPERPAEPARTHARNGRILVIDDEVNICRVLHRILTQEGHEVDTVVTAEAALEQLSTQTYDLVLLDIKMPGMSGIDLFHRMSEADPRFREKVVFVTGDIVSAKNKTFIEETGVNYITKPFTGDILMRQVNMTLGGQNTCISGR